MIKIATGVWPSVMRILCVFIVLIGMASSAWSFQCPQEHSLKKAYKEAERAFLIYVTETKLEESLFKKMARKHSEISLESDDIRLVSAGYRIIEEFKGPKKYQPRLIDMLGIGTGYVGMTPGQYYLVLLPGQESEDFEGKGRVDICSVPHSHYRLKVEQFQSELNVISAMRDEG